VIIRRRILTLFVALVLSGLPQRAATGDGDNDTLAGA
jgi:hypothetical protein